VGASANARVFGREPRVFRDVFEGGARGRVLLTVTMSVDRPQPLSPGTEAPGAAAAAGGGASGHLRGDGMDVHEEQPMPGPRYRPGRPGDSSWNLRRVLSDGALPGWRECLAAPMGARPLTHAASGAAEAEAHPQLEPDAVGRQALLDRISHAADEPEAETEPRRIAT
jgi:hypothetical protein